MGLNDTFRRYLRGGRAETPQLDPAKIVEFRESLLSHGLSENTVDEIILELSRKKSSPFPGWLGPAVVGGVVTAGLVIAVGLFRLQPSPVPPGSPGITVTDQKPAAAPERPAPALPPEIEPVTAAAPAGPSTGRDEIPLTAAAPEKPSKPEPPAVEPAVESPEPAPAMETQTPIVGDTATAVYAIQLGAFSQRKALNETRRALKRAGYEPYEVPPPDPGGLTRLMVGRFSTRKEADRVNAELRKKTNLDSFIVTR